MPTSRAVPVLEARDAVGGSIVRDDRSNRVAWVGIIGKPDFPTSIGLRKDGGDVVGLLHDIMLWDFDATWRQLATPGRRAAPQARSKRSRFITLSHAATKSATNLPPASELA
jgi:sugar lactone lactonase YvrE